jgi:hypothetical protein
MSMTKQLTMAFSVIYSLVDLFYLATTESSAVAQRVLNGNQTWKSNM